MNRNPRRARVMAAIALVTLALAGCRSSSGENVPAGADPSGGIDYANLTGSLKASGASFPDAFYQEVIDAFLNVAPKVTVTYNPIGSSAGKKEFGQGLTDVAGTDSTVKDSDGVPSGSFVYVPTVAAPITISYHLSEVPKLQLSPDTIAKIFSRAIKQWNDPAIAADNPGVALPNKLITVAHRSDGSGTTSNFTAYLTKAAPKSWTLGSGDTIAWPADTLGGAKNTGVAQIIKQTDGAIGYVDLADAKASSLTFAAVKNKDGNYVLPTLEATTAALAGASVQANLTYDPLDASGAAAYPITAPTYLLVRTSYPDPAKATLVRAFVTYLLTDGQALAEDVDFAPLPDNLRQRALNQLATL